MKRSAICIALAGTALLGACGGDGDSTTSVPDGAVAIVGDAEISNEQLDARTETLRRTQRLSAGERRAQRKDPALRAQADERLREQALALLLMGEAIEQEAAKRGIAVDTAEVRERWHAVASTQFPNQRALRRFLGGQTERDVVAQLRLQTLSDRINEQVAEQAGGGKRGARAAKRFREEFTKRWQGETACRAGIDAAGCPSD